MVKLLASALLLLVIAPTPPISVEVMPRMGMAPKTVRITVRVEPNENNRGMALVIDSGSYYESSFDPDFVGLEGPRIRKYQRDLRVAGNYVITAIIQRAFPDSNKQASVELCLIGPGVEC